MDSQVRSDDNMDIMEAIKEEYKNLERRYLSLKEWREISISEETIEYISKEISVVIDKQFLIRDILKRANIDIDKMTFEVFKELKNEETH